MSADGSVVVGFSGSSTARPQAFRWVNGTMTGLGASFSPTFAGFVSDTFGSNYAFFGLAIIALLGLAVVTLLMPETRAAGRGVER